MFIAKDHIRGVFYVFILQIDCVFLNPRNTRSRNESKGSRKRNVLTNLNNVSACAKRRRKENGNLRKSKKEKQRGLRRKKLRRNTKRRQREEKGKKRKEDRGTILKILENPWIWRKFPGLETQPQYSECTVGPLSNVTCSPMAATSQFRVSVGQKM